MGEEVDPGRRETRHPHPDAPLLTRLRSLLETALELGPAELDAFLLRLSRDAPDDARELTALLAAEPELDAIRFLSIQSGYQLPADATRPPNGQSRGARG